MNPWKTIAQRSRGTASATVVVVLWSSFLQVHFQHLSFRVFRLAASSPFPLPSAFQFPGMLVHPAVDACHVQFKVFQFSSGSWYSVVRLVFQKHYPAKKIDDAVLSTFQALSRGLHNTSQYHMLMRCEVTWPVSHFSNMSPWKVII